MRRRPIAPARGAAVLVVLMSVAVLAAAVAGCGSSGSSSSAGGGKPQLVVSAAASLKAAFTNYAMQFSAATARFSFAGSDVLAAQIEQGLKPDVFASANTKLPDMLYTKGMVEKPVVFAANKLADVEKPGVAVAIGSSTVPIGTYTRTVLARLGPALSAKIMANVRTEEPDVSGIVGKLTQGAVDAGFTYITDVKATDGKLQAIALPAGLQPVVAYGVAVVKGARHPAQAQQFITGLLSGHGRSDLLQAGFLPPPGQ
jgi:molybdate transport system substrate-binding protein